MSSDQTIIYKLYCKSFEDCKSGYIGTTSNLSRKKHFHKVNTNNFEKKSDLYSTIRMYGGWDNWQFETFIYSSDAEMHAMEDKYKSELERELSTIEPQRKYVCDLCDVTCGNKFNYGKHCQTQKHINQRNKINKMNSLNHQIQEQKSQLEQQKKDKNDELSAMMTMMEKNDNLTHRIIEMSKDKSITQTNNVNNNNSTNNHIVNNKFSLNLFLNETCKDAFNLSDFVRQLNLDVDDLVHTGQVGFAEGMSHIFIKGLENVESNKRPIYCSDLKRETLYVKENDIWEKESMERSRIIDAVRQIGRDNIKTLDAWRDKHPDYKDYDSKANTQYMRIIGNAMPGCTDEEIAKNYKKVIHNVAREVSIANCIK